MDITTLQNFRADVRKHLQYTYLIEGTGKVVWGNSTSHLLDSVRRSNSSGRRWKNLGGDSRFEEICQRAGFRVLRGRTRRIYHGGKYSWGVPCDVITEEVEVPCFSEYEAYTTKFNGFFPYLHIDAEDTLCVDPDEN